MSSLELWSSLSCNAVWVADVQMRSRWVYIVYITASLEMHRNAVCMHGELLRPKLEPKSSWLSMTNGERTTEIGRVLDTDRNLTRDPMTCQDMSSRQVSTGPMRLLRCCCLFSGAYYKAWPGYETRIDEGVQWSPVNVNEFKARKLQNACGQVWF